MNTKREKLNLANKNSTEITGEGTARLHTNIHGELRSIHLENTQLVSDLRMNLLSVAKITDHGYDKQKGLVTDQNGMKLIANRINDLYIVKESVNEIAVAEETGTEKATQSKADWHRRFGHLNARNLQEAICKGRIEGIKPGNLIITAIFARKERRQGGVRF